MSEQPILVKLVVKNANGEIEEHSFEQDMIKIGRGRKGKARKGVDLQLDDPSISRVHIVIHIRKLDDIFAMGMGGVTLLNGKKVGSRSKLSNLSVLELGDTTITVYIGEEASAEVAIEERQILEDVVEPSPFFSPDGPPDETSSSIEGSFEILDEQSLTPEDVLSANSDGVLAEALNSEESQIPVGENDNLGDYQLYPSHTTPEGVVGIMGPLPSPLPLAYQDAIPKLFYDVFDRLGKEIWVEQDKIW